MQMLLSNNFKLRSEHGGSLVSGKRKSARPISTKKPLHLVFRSEVAIGSLSLKRHQILVNETLKSEAKRFNIKVYQYSINSNHLHLCIKASTREGFRNFLRVFSGKVAKEIIKRSQFTLKKFWSHLAYTRIVEWGKAFQIVRAYIFQNELETKGLIPYAPRKRKSILRGDERESWKQ